jgi:hypothetical protein
MKIRGVGQKLPPMQRAAFEQTCVELQNSVLHNDTDSLDTICGALFTNTRFGVGTGLNDVFSQDTMDTEITDHLLSQTNTTSNNPNTTSNNPNTTLAQCKSVVIQSFEEPIISLTFFHDCKDRKILCVKGDDSVYSFPCTGIFPTDLFQGTILTGYVREHLGRSIMVVTDCLMVCGNRCSVLRYDQRIEISREVIFRLAGNQNDYDTTLMNHTPHDSPLYQFKNPLPSRLPKLSQCITKLSMLPFDMTCAPVMSATLLKRAIPTIDILHRDRKTGAVRTMDLRVMSVEQEISCLHTHSGKIMRTLSMDHQICVGLSDRRAPKDDNLIHHLRPTEHVMKDWIRTGMINQTENTLHMHCTHGTTHRGNQHGLERVYVGVCSDPFSLVNLDSQHINQTRATVVWNHLRSAWIISEYHGHHGREVDEASDVLRKIYCLSLLPNAC